MSATVDIIIPCYNYGRFLGETLDSVLSQTAAPSRIIVVDDGSTDDTAEVCRRYTSVTYVWKPNGGVSSARNLGLDSSDSECVLFLDADDVLFDDALETLRDAMDHVKGRAMVVFGTRELRSIPGIPEPSGKSCFPDPDEIRQLPAENLDGAKVLLSRGIVGRLLRNNVIGAGCTIARREAIESVGRFDESLTTAEDQDFWLRVAARFPVAYVDRAFAYYRRHEVNLTDSVHWIANHLNVLKVQRKAMDADWADADLRRMARRQYAATALHVATRYAELGEMKPAARLARGSVRCNPFRWKSWAKLVLYSLSPSKR